MTFCEGCGVRRSVGDGFCVHCGRAFVRDEPPPQSGGSLGQKLSLAGPLALIFFFVPWITVSCQMTGFAVALSGWELATGVTLADQKLPGQPVLLLVPLAAGGLLVLGLLARGGLTGARTLWGIAQMVLAAGPLVLMLTKYAAWVEDARRNTGSLVSISPHVGFVLTLAALAAAGLGAFLEMKPARGSLADSRAGPARGEPAPSVPLASQAVVPGFCPQCGTRSGALSRFCVECGHALV